MGIAITMTLEVFGAVGATWGFSEVFGFRDESNLEGWRSTAMTIGAMSFFAYCCRHFYMPKEPPLHRNSFFAALRHAMDKPYEAVYSEFIYKDEEERGRLLSA